MSYVDVVLDALKEKGYEIYKEPKRATIQRCSYGFNEKVTGNCIEYYAKDGMFSKVVTLFVADKERVSGFHNGYSKFFRSDLPIVIWFKENLDKITIIEGFYI